MNVPNALSLIRLLMVPLFASVYFLAGDYAHYWAGGIYALATFTDFLDGFIARKYKQITKLGRVLDPLADKLMAFTVLVCLVIKGLIPWWAASVYFVKEALTGLGALLLYKRIDDVPPSNFLGKFSTVFFFVVCLAIMLVPQLSQTIRYTMICVALAFTVVAFVVYISKFTGYLKKDRS